MSSGPTQLELLEEATSGFDALLNNDLPTANRILSSQPESPFHLLGLGLTAFLAAALGQEDTELFGALAILSKAEAAATLGISKRGKGEPTTVYPAGTEYRVLIADAVVCQALVHVLTESYLEFMKAVYKLNRSYTAFGAVYKIVFPTGVAEEDSLATIYKKLNESYLSRKAAPPPSVASSLFGWRKRSPSHILRHASSTATLPTIGSLSLAVPDGDNGLTASAPTSRPLTRENSVEAVPPILPSVSSGEVLPKAEWEGDALSTLVISGASFGFGLFGLIFSLLPPKLRKLIAWFGFSNSNRPVALKLLTVAASTGNDVHGYFASLALVTYYCVVLLMSGWQSEEEYLVEQCTAVLARVEAKFPSGTLWVLNRAKICRMKHDTTSAIAILEAALEKGSTFREADSLLVFELSWCYLSDGQWLKCADSFLHMRELNSWSHATYVFIAAGALLDLPRAERTPEIEGRIDALVKELPSLFGMKRLLGEPPATEMFITRKLTVYQAKWTRWVAQGRIPASSKYWEVIRVSPASELGLFWNTNGRAPHAAVQKQIDHLISFSPLPKYQPLSLAASTMPVVPLLEQDLDSVDETATRDLLLGALYRSLGDYVVARSFLRAVIDAESTIVAEKWIVPFAMFELAVLECKEGEEKASTMTPVEARAQWKATFKAADKLLESIFAQSEFYDLRSRLESRAQMLRDEVAARRSKASM